MKCSLVIRKVIVKTVIKNAIFIPILMRKLLAAHEAFHDANMNSDEGLIIKALEAVRALAQFASVGFFGLRVIYFYRCAG